MRRERRIGEECGVVRGWEVGGGEGGRKGEGGREGVECGLVAVVGGTKGGGGRFGWEKFRKPAGRLLLVCAR